MVDVDLTKKKYFEFLTKGRPKLLRLAVVGKKRRPHVSSVWYIWKDNYFYISTSEDRLKAKVLRDNPNVALIIDTDVKPYNGVIVEGKAELTKKNVKDVTLSIAKRYVSKKYVKAQFEDLMRHPRVLVKVKPKKSIDIMSYKTR